MFVGVGSGVLHGHLLDVIFFVFFSSQSDPKDQKKKEGAFKTGHFFLVGNMKGRRFSVFVAPPMTPYDPLPTTP